MLGYLPCISWQQPGAGSCRLGAFVPPPSAPYNIQQAGSMKQRPGALAGRNAANVYRPAGGTTAQAAGIPPPGRKAS